MAKKPSKKDYEKSKRSAYELIVVQGYTQSDAAELTGVSENTISRWSRQENWKELRAARQSAVSTANNRISFECLVTDYAAQALFNEVEMPDREIETVRSLSESEASPSEPMFDIS
jgi:transposase